MEPVVVLTSILRLLLVAAVYCLNATALVKLVSKTPSTGSCVHVLTSATVLLAGLLYLSSWAPYLVYSLTDGKWLLLGANRHCLLQHFVTSEISAVLLALLAVRVLYSYLVKVMRRPPPTARAASLAVCLAWLGPQLVYDAMTVAIDGQGRERPRESSYRFLDDVMELPTHGGAHYPNVTRGYRVGFMVCLQSLDPNVLSSFGWQYAVVVLPLSTLVLFCGARLLLGSKNRKGALMSRKSTLPAAKSGQAEVVLFTDMSGYPYGNSSNAETCRSDTCSRSCSRDTLVDMALYYNLIWLLALRPLAVLHALYLQAGSPTEGATGASYIDIGSHLVLTFSCVFSPFSPRVGLCGRVKSRKDCLTGTENGQQLLDCCKIPEKAQLGAPASDPKVKDFSCQMEMPVVNHQAKKAEVEFSGESFC